MTPTQPTIVLTTDGSADSLTAVPPTVALAKRLRAHVIVLSVVCDGPLPSALAAGFGCALTPDAMPRLPMAAAARNRDIEAELAAIRARVDEIAASVRAELPAADVETAVLRGECPEAVIASLAAVRGAQFIAMASHGRTGLSRLLLGSVTESVIRRASTPVIVFPVAA